MEAAVTEYHEILKQEIYLAGPNEMNDPNEGQLNMSWGADEVAWDGLVNHFLRATALTQASIASEQEMAGGVIVPGYHHLTRQAEGFAQDIAQLAEIRESARTTTAGLYGKTFVADRLAAALEPLNEKVHEALAQYRFTGAALVPIVYETDGGRSIPRFHFPSTPPDWAWRLPKPSHRRIPALYLAKMSEMTTRPWYAACFSKTYESQAMWLHYGQAGRGICMEFDTDYLQSENGELLDVRYETLLLKVEFFPYLVRITELEGMNIYKNGNRTSLLVPDFVSEEHRVNWHNEVVERTKQIALTKTDDWRAEEEVRLLRIDLLDRGPGHITYPSKALTGIIFGERATEETKHAVRSIMISKHRHSPLEHFLFFDAVTQPNGRVHRMPSEEQIYRM